MKNLRNQIQKIEEEGKKSDLKFLINGVAVLIIAIYSFIAFSNYFQF